MTESPVCSNSSEASKLAPQSDVESSSPSRPKIVSANADDRQQSIVGSVDVPVNNKMEIVFSLLSMLSTQGRRESSETFLRMSRDAQHCVLLRESGCLALIIRLLHPSEVSAVQPTSEDVEVFHRASEALRNIARFQKEKTAQHRELKILRCLEKIRLYVLHLRFQRCTSSKSKLLLTEKEVLSAIASLMKWSFEEDNRSATCFFGGLESICEALIMDQLVFKTEPPENHILCRKYIGMTLTNLTFGAARSKQVLCGNMNFLRTVNEQIRSNDDDLKQVFASVLRNLSWKAEDSSKAALQQNHTVALLTEAAMRSKKETTLKSILSALWNLTSHCAENQMEVCTVPQAVQFLALTLKRSTAAGNNAIVENCGGILRNISACIADREEWRSVLRQTGCYQVLMEHLGAKSLTVISNACGALWNLSNSSVQEQKLLCELGAVELLQTLTQSKHALIRLASSATLKNLQTFVQKVANRSIEGEMLRNGSSSPPSRRHGLDEVGQSRTATLRRLFEPDSRLMINSKESLESPLTVQTTDLMEPSFSGPSLVDQESAGPMETLKRFAVEGTPAHLSRRSSLTSLHQGLVQEESCKAENETKMDKTAEAVVKKEQTAVTVVSAKAMKTGDGGGAIDGNGGDGGDSSGGGVGGGSGDVGDGVRVEVCGSGSGEGVGGAPVFTPMMFSRHSSLQSLNSCELQSIHSTVYSEYSYYPTALVSPSDIPDSPGQSALVSPSLPADGSANKPLLAKGDDVFDLPRIYNYEGSSRGGLSAASSLSALTIDVETKVKPAATGFDLLDLKSCIQSAQPNKSTSVIQRSLNRKTPAVSTQQFEQSNSSKPAYETAVGDEVVKSFADEGNEIQQAPNSPVTDIHSLIQLAMPKPKSSESATAQLRSASAARAKPNKAKNSSTTDNSSNTTSTGSARRVQQQQQQQLPPPPPQEKKAAETRSASQSSATSGTSGNTSKGSVPRSELRECIYSAFPKPHARRKNRPAEPRNPNTQANRSNTERPTTTNYTSSVSQPKLIS
ncbi:Adenomatous polyposis coli protein [Trichinella papuae]|uniref:Adenomatous polyposis coli protein n=1 Tax=Trichinella papuae TaxID=268474 RepID=A0A0V1MMH9_9BILA|nr:Adenomatous polyposis coli protein [Trichinella papuae]KRZ72786.1 Adenomatous polyposis coli protein [Trichinella papuae]